MAGFPEDIETGRQATGTKVVTGAVSADMSEVQMDWLDLTAFCEVAKHASFTKAAERMHLTQPVLSTRIRRLERMLGVELLHRSTRRVTLSQPGHRLLRHVQGLRQSWHHAVADVTRGDIRFTVATTIPELCSLAAATNHHFPHLRVEYELRIPGTALPAVGAGFDAVQGADPLFHNVVPPAQVEIGTIVHEPVWVMLSEQHPLAAHSRIRLHALSDEAWIEAPESSDELIAICIEAGFVPDIRYRSRTLPAVDLIQACNAVSLIQARVPAPAGCVTRPLDIDVRRHIFYAWHSGTPQSIVRFQYDFLRAGYRKLAFRNPAYRQFIESEPQRFAELHNTV
ncbi:LysR family transcriptional regulator [Nocardia terpenica]|uniref:LysR family transcriptional regulator n=1 Tax=Nocardia terpenica TaxID=455432 RepID=UPI0012E93CB8|nr:LysR family transcriptional regulator [Nocardia terpenica]NQE92401.1 LysR family transcriptional regulator [Nocardia terpenica]